MDGRIDASAAYRWRRHMNQKAKKKQRATTEATDGCYEEWLQKILGISSNTRSKKFESLLSDVLRPSERAWHSSTMKKTRRPIWNRQNSVRAISDLATKKPGPKVFDVCSTSAPSTTRTVRRYPSLKPVYGCSDIFVLNIASGIFKALFYLPCYHYHFGKVFTFSLFAE